MKEGNRTPFNFNDLVHCMFESDVLSKIDNMGLPYEETTYRHIVEDIIADYNAGRDKTKQGIICSQYEKENTGFDKLGKGYEKRCSREMMANYINAKSSNALLFMNTMDGTNYLENNL